MDNNRIEEGGFIIPRVAYIDEARPGFFFSFIRLLGWKIMGFGSWIRSLGYSQKEFHPYEDLLSAMKRAKVERGE